MTRVADNGVEKYSSDKHQQRLQDWLRLNCNNFLENNLEITVIFAAKTINYERRENNF